MRTNKSISRKEYNKKFRRYSDKEFLEFYNRGFSDTNIAKIFGVSVASIFFLLKFFLFKFLYYKNIRGHKTSNGGLTFKYF